MADGNQEGLGASGKEPSSKEELFSGSLESPEGDESKGSESPQAQAQNQGSGASSGESTDSELEGIFTDLEKDIPEALKNHATNVKKKMQGYFTKKNQSFSEKIKSLEANQITDDIRKNYQVVSDWNNRIRQNPVEGIRALAFELGVSPQALFNTGRAEPETPELTPDKLETRDDYVNFLRQEVRKAIEEVRTKEVKPLQETLSQFQGNNERTENIQRGSAAIEEAKRTLQGFEEVDSEGNKKISKAGNEAIAAVLRGEFYGPNALKNAFKAAIADSSIGKVKQLETSLASLKTNIAGASNPPERKTPKTTTAPSKTDRFWGDLRSEPLAPN